MPDAQKSKDPKPALKADRFYWIEDHCRCGTLRCAGMSAYYTGRSIHGVKVKRVTAAQIENWPKDLTPLHCEMCKKRAL